MGGATQIPSPATVQVAAKTPVSNGKLIVSVLGIIIGVALCFAPLPLSVLGKATLGLSIWFIFWCCAGMISVGYASLIYLLALLLLHFKPAIVWGMFTLSGGWFLIAAFVFASVMMRCGLAKRVAYLIMYKLHGNTPVKFMFCIVVLSYLMVLLIPSPIANMAVLFPIFGYVAEEWNLQGRQEQNQGTSVLGVIGAYIVIMGMAGGFWIKPGFSQNLVSLTIARTDVSFVKWFLIAAPTMWMFALVFAILSVLLFRFPKHVVAPLEGLRVKYTELGPVSKVERRVLLIAVILFILYGTESLHGIASGWIAVLGMCLFAIPAVGVFGKFEEMFASVNWSVVLLVTALYALAVCFQISGVTGMLVHALAPLQPHSVFGFYMLSNFFGTIVTGIVGLNVAQAVVIPLFTSWGQAVGLPAGQSFLAIWTSAGAIGGDLLAPTQPQFALAWSFKYRGAQYFSVKDAVVMTLVGFVAYWIAAVPTQLLLWHFVH